MTTKPARLSYVILSRAWYRKANLFGRTDSNCEVFDVIHFGNYYPEGGCDWEASITFMRFDPLHTGVKIELFSDGWQALSDCPEMLAAFTRLAHKAGEPSPTVDQIATALTDAGFADKTPTVNPYTAVKPAKRVRANA